MSLFFILLIYRALFLFSNFFVLFIVPFNFPKRLILLLREYFQTEAIAVIEKKTVSAMINEVKTGLVFDIKE